MLPKLVVANTSPLLALARIGRLSVLPGLFGSVICPQAVVDEILAGEQRYGVVPELLGAPWLSVRENPSGMELRKDLGPGETAAITLAHQLRADLTVLDDLSARLVATGLGLTVSGTLGVLVAAHRTGLIEDLAAAFRNLQDAGFRVSTSLLDSILRE